MAARGTRLVTAGLAALLLLAPADALATPFASLTRTSGTFAALAVGAVTDLDCTSTVGVAGAVKFAWRPPPALAGKPSEPLRYTVRRRANGGAWTTLTTTWTSTSYSDDPSLLLSLGTLWEYDVTPSYGAWVGTPPSTTVRARYVQLIVTVLDSCTP